MRGNALIAAGAIALSFLVPSTAPMSALAADPAPAAAADKLAPPVIAVLDVQKVMQESEASKSIQTAIEAQRDAYQKEIAGLEDKLRSAEQALRKQQTVLSPEALAGKRKEFEKQVADTQRTAQTRKRALDVALSEGMGLVQKTMVEILAEVARDKGANMVIARHQLVIMDTKLDVTDTVMTELNKRLPKVEVAIPKN